MDLADQTRNLEMVFLMVAGFLCGAVPAFLLLGFFFGRKLEQDRRELQLSYERQVTALRETLRRLLNRMEAVTGERDELQQTNEALRAAVRDQHQITDQSSHQLEEAQQNIRRMQDRIDDLEAEQLRNEGRLEQATRQQEQVVGQLENAIAQFTQAERMRQNLLFAATELRETKISNAALEARLARGLEPLPEDGGVAPSQQDVGMIEGLEPVYAERLHESGIHTIGDLARQTPARVAHFAGLTTWDDSAAWIAEAKLRLATSQHPRA